jgi:D-3-phosphoglycerate dehydrogenase
VSSAILIFDSLFDDLAIETETAAARGWTLARWDGGDASLRDAEVAMHVRTRIDRPLFDRMPAVRVVTRFGTGVDTVDPVVATERGVAVVNVRDYCVPEMTAHTLALALSLDRRVGELATTSLDWSDIAEKLPLPGRRSATVIGLGAVGRSVARTLLAMGLTVSAVTRQADAARALGIPVVPLEEGLGTGAFVFLHAALNADTAGLIGGAELARMQPHAILVNTARLGLIDEAAVASALEQGRIGGVGIDARLPPGSPLDRLRGHPRLIVTPHVGWLSTRSAAELRRRAVENTIAAAEDQRSRAAEQNRRRAT